MVVTHGCASGERRKCCVLRLGLCFVVNMSRREL